VSEPRSVASQPFAERRRGLIDDEQLRGPAFGRAYAALLDDWLAELLGDTPGVAFVACGGLGRREVAPESDLDLLLLHDPRVDPKEIADRIWYPVWDQRLSLDHSVRTPKEAVRVAGDDLKTALTLLDGRVVAGDAGMGEAMLAAVRDAWIRRSSRRLPPLDAISASRHRADGDLAYLLEPDLKQAKGGLRDLAVIRAVRVAVGETGDESTTLVRAFEDIFTTRVELHRSTGRRGERLLLEAQDDVAARLGVDADALMTRLASGARSIARAYDDVVRRAHARLAGPRARTAPGADRDLAVGVVLRDGEVDIAADAPRPGIALLLDVAEAAAQEGAPIAPRALELLDAHVAPESEPWPERARHALVALLGSGERLVDVFEALDEYDLVTRILPEWRHVRSRPQRNVFHRFTVDRHLTETAVQAAAYVRDVARPDLLLVGAWLHDLGKGFPGDHTDAGVRLMSEIALRMGFDAADRDVLVSLVRHHLLLPSIATSRDLDDPATLHVVAGAVQSSEVLFLLAALTKADSLATGPTAWSDWKEQLVRLLVERVHDLLAGRELRVDTIGSVSEDEELVRRAGAGVLVEHDGDVVTIVAADRPGLLSTVVAVLTVCGGDVRSADVGCHDGVVVDRVSAVPSQPRVPIDWLAFDRDLVQALGDDVELDDAVRRRTYAHRRRRSAARSPSPDVIVHPVEAASTARVIEVRAEDTPGLLYRITRSIAGRGLDIAQARVSTLGHEVVDTFYVTTLTGGTPDEATLGELAASLRATLAGEVA
jgi:[protein-PII] uridylyltransferase